MSNSPVSPALTVSLPSRTDGSTTGNRPIRIRPGEVLLVAVECVKIAGNWLWSAGSVTVVDVDTPSGELEATYDSVRDSLVLLSIDGTDAGDGDAWRVLFDVHPTEEQTIKGEIGVECEDD